MADLCAKWRDLEVFCNGCRNECDQKCVIDNHEVEILQYPTADVPYWGDGSCCPSMRAGGMGDLCTPGRPGMEPETDTSLWQRGADGYRDQNDWGRSLSASFRGQTVSSGLAGPTFQGGSAGVGPAARGAGLEPGSLTSSARDGYGAPMSTSSLGAGYVGSGLLGSGLGSGLLGSGLQPA